jgi:hypothetical protein
MISLKKKLFSISFSISLNQHRNNGWDLPSAVKKWRVGNFASLWFCFFAIMVLPLIFLAISTALVGGLFIAAMYQFQQRGKCQKIPGSYGILFLGEVLVREL